MNKECSTGATFDDRVIEIEDPREVGYWVKFLGTTRDELLAAISEVGLRAQDVRWHLNEKAKRMVDSVDDAVVRKSLEGIVSSWDANAARLFGFEAREMIGRNITAIIPPELYSEEAEILAKVRAGERIEHYETMRVAKDGTRKAVSLTVSPVRDKSGKIVGASKIAREMIKG